MTILIWGAYTLTVIATYNRVKAWRPDWQMRAEVAAMSAGLVALFLLVVAATPTYTEVEPWTPAIARPVVEAAA